jgi:hypothetical protein
MLLDVTLCIKCVGCLGFQAGDDGAQAGVSRRLIAVVAVTSFDIAHGQSQGTALMDCRRIYIAVAFRDLGGEDVTSTVSLIVTCWCWMRTAGHQYLLSEQT